VRNPKDTRFYAKKIAKGMRKEENCNSERFEKANMQDVIDAPQQVQTRSQE